MKKSLIEQVFAEMKPVLEEAYEEIKETLILPTTRNFNKRMEIIQRKVNENIRRET